MTKDEIEKWHEAHPYGARDEVYVDAVLAHVKRLWLARPRQRLGQVLFNVSQARDIFHVLDERWAPEKAE